MTTIISHPGKPLIQHLREVARFCRATVMSKHFSTCIESKVLEDLAFIQGAVHDIGKATKNFQTYIHSAGKTVIRPKHHALISAFLAKQIAIKYLSNANVSELERELLPFFLFTSVKRHHGHMKNFDFELESIRGKEEDLEILPNNFYDEEVQEILNELLIEVSLSYDWNDFKTYMQELEHVFIEFEDYALDSFPDAFKELPNLKKTAYFYIHQLFFSSLLFSDKSDVKLGQDKSLETTSFDYNAISQFREKHGWNKPSIKEIDRLKNQAYFEGLENIRQTFDPEKHLYSITLPTGLGKTITSLGIAMEIKKMLATQNPRIIITIPFTSIIDQNYTVFNEIFNAPSSKVLLKHHHLAEPKYKTADEDEVLVAKDVETSKFLIETWQSEIVVTTFVQLIEGLFTNHKGKLLKFPNLCNAIIILDEIQQIKYELWELIRTAFKVLGDRFNCYFILMSATQPLIFEPEKEIHEIIPNYQQYFKFFNRTKLINKTSSIVELDEFSNTVINYCKTNPEKSILIILNTKQVTLDCFEVLKNEISEESANLYFLTTALTPFERKAIIRRIKEPINKLPNIIVSTQLIEAGVDISVHTVFRALAPLDSIIQAAGRANRYYERPEVSEVFLYRIKELEKPTSMLYGPDLILKTMNVLESVETINESDYLQLIQAYFKEIRKQSDNKISKELEALQQLKFGDVGQFQFIPYRKMESVYVQLNLTAKKLWEKYCEIYRNQATTVFEKRAQFALIKATFYDYVVNVPVGWDQEHIDFDSEPQLHFYVSNLENPSKCYHYDENSFRVNTGYQAVKEHTKIF